MVHRTPHPLCPIYTLCFYLAVTASASQETLFIWHDSLKHCAARHIGTCLEHINEKADPGKEPRLHEVRGTVGLYVVSHPRSGPGCWAVEVYYILPSAPVTCPYMWTTPFVWPWASLPYPFPLVILIPLKVFNP